MKLVWMLPRTVSKAPPSRRPARKRSRPSAYSAVGFVPDCFAVFHAGFDRTVADVAGNHDFLAGDLGHEGVDGIARLRQHAGRGLAVLLNGFGRRSRETLDGRDRNGDGDVSRREFLGTDEEFRKIDTDGDGLISREEAEKADERFRKQKEQQR